MICRKCGYRGKAHAEDSTACVAKVALIDRIVEAARKPVPEVVQSIVMKHKTTGKEYSLFGMPFGYNSNDFEPVVRGFVFQDRNGTRYGAVEATAELLRKRYTDNQDAIAAEFRRELINMPAPRFMAQVDYWLKPKLNGSGHDARRG
jgi:hypothetical protein